MPRFASGSWSWAPPYVRLTAEAALLFPVGPAGPQFTGLAVDLRDDGLLLLDTDRWRVAIPPQDLGDLEEAL